MAIFRRLAGAGRPPRRPTTSGSAAPLLAQQLLMPWGEQVNRLRAAIVETMVERVTIGGAEHERQFDLVLTAFGAILFAMLESVVLLSERVVSPLAQLGIAITRIATGDRGVPLTLHSGTREINEMVTAVETLRQAALVADAAAMRRRHGGRATDCSLCARRSASCRTVREPAHALERGVARLSRGIDATIALLRPPRQSRRPPTLGVAADAVRLGLAEMREFGRRPRCHVRRRGQTETGRKRNSWPISGRCGRRSIGGTRRCAILCSPV